MLLQTMALLAIMLLVVGSLLTNALVTAKASAQQAVTRHITAALNRGGDEATNWAQRYVAINGADAQWPKEVQTDMPRKICLTREPSTLICPLSEVTTYAIVGSTSASTATKGPDRASNLQGAVNENRIALVITASLRNSGVEVGSRSRRLTVRVFDGTCQAFWYRELA